MGSNNTKQQHDKGNDSDGLDQQQENNVVKTISTITIPPIQLLSQQQQDTEENLTKPLLTLIFDKTFIERTDGMPIIIFEHPSMSMERFSKEISKKNFNKLTLYLPGLGKIIFKPNTVNYKVYKQSLQKSVLFFYDNYKLTLFFDKTKPNYTFNITSEYLNNDNLYNISKKEELFFERSREVNQQFLLFKLRKYYRYLELENNKKDWLWDLPLETRSTIISFLNVKEMVGRVSLISKSFYVATYIYLLRDFIGFGHINDIPIFF